MEFNKENTTLKTIPNDVDKEQKGINVPNLRFPSFKSKWEKNYFKDELDLLKNNTLSRAELNYKSGKIKNIHYGDILVKFENYICSNSKQIPYINEENIPKNYKSMLLKSGDLIIADTAEDYTVGKSVEIINNDENMVISGLHTIPCRPKQSQFALKYLGYYTNSPSFHNQLLPLIQGIKVSSISKSQIKETYISYPVVKEQEKIVKFLELTSSRINTQSKIIEDLETQMKAIRCYLLSNINTFSSLSDLCSISTGKLDANCMNENGEYPFFTCGKETLKIDDYAFDCEAILISGNGDIGHTKYYVGKFNAYQRTYVLHSFKGNAKYIKSAIDYVLPRKVLEETQSSAMPYIKMGTLSDLKIPFPSLTLQNRIVDVLEVFQHKLKIEAQILEKLSQEI